MPAMAFRAGISGTRRTALGRWARAETADVYTRRMGDIVLDIWNEVLDAPPTSDPMAEAAVDLLDRAYFPVAGPLLAYMSDPLRVAADAAPACAAP